MLCVMAFLEKNTSDGDILNIDITVGSGGWYGDTSRMFYVGTPSIKAQRLTEVTCCLMRGIEQQNQAIRLVILVMPFNHMRSHTAIQLFATLSAMGLVRYFTQPRPFCIMANQAADWR